MYIAIEGIDGAGTTTQAKMLAEWLREHGNKVGEVTEPSTGKIGRCIRSLLKEGELKPAYPYLFAADRMVQTESISRLLEQGVFDVVVSDRCYWSSVAYQGQDVGAERVRVINKDVRQPNVVILLDLPAGEALERVAKRSGSRDCFETIGFMEEARKALL